MIVNLLEQLRISFPALERVPISCGDGWYEILVTLFERIDPSSVSVAAVEQKYGSLRIIIEGKIPAEVDAIITAAEAESERVCERCGAPGRLRPDPMWWETLCHSCARMRAEKAYWRIENYSWLALLANGRTTAEQLDGRACRALYESATLIETEMLDDTERELMSMLEVPKAELDRSFEILLHDTDKLSAGLDSVLTCSLDQFMSEIQEIRAMREHEDKK